MNGECPEFATLFGAIERAATGSTKLDDLSAEHAAMRDRARLEGALSPSPLVVDVKHSLSGIDLC